MLWRQNAFITKIGHIAVAATLQNWIASFRMKVWTILWYIFDLVLWSQNNHLNWISFAVVFYLCQTFCVTLYPDKRHYLWWRQTRLDYVEPSLLPSDPQEMVLCSRHRADMDLLARTRAEQSDALWMIYNHFGSFWDSWSGGSENLGFK